MTPLERYQSDSQQPDFVIDAGQQQVVELLEELYHQTLDWQKVQINVLSRLRTLFGQPQDKPKGLYLWGAVGRGKTYLMDLFFHTLPIKHKKRLHFHRFMQQVHNDLKKYKGQENPLQFIGQDIAAETKVLCFDEFFVSEIADAMLLKGLFEALLANNVILVATSNIPPEKLYEKGLHRQRFMPVIELIEHNTQVIKIPDGDDYRLRLLEQAEVYHSPLDEAANVNIQTYFNQLLPEKDFSKGQIEVCGRMIETRGYVDDVVWFDFLSICDGPRSQNDYIEIAKCFHTVLISNIPQLEIKLEAQARRFISLIDEFYDRNVKLIVTAAVPIEMLYEGELLSFEFERTKSRLTEMQTHDYLARPHQP